MFKKSLIMLVLLAMAVAANASTSSVWFEVDAQDAASGYLPSDIITINLVADFDVGSISLSIGADGGAAEAVGTLHPGLSIGTVPYYAGTLYNDLGILIIGIGGGMATSESAIPAGQVLYSFEFHVPDVQESTTIIIDDVTGTNPLGGAPLGTAVADKNYSIYLTDVGSLAIHVIPEPMTMSLLVLGGLFLRRRK